LEADQVLAQDSETGMVWSLADQLGSIDVLINAQGVIVDQRTYDSFGNTLNQLDPTVKFRFGYTGRESDPETGLYYYRARYFDANVGRFISTDPIGFEAGDSNLYRYVNNSPTLATDPTGEWINIAVGAVVGGLIGFGISTARQFAKISDGGSFDINEVLTATAFGVVGGAVVGANPLLAAPLALFGAAQGGISSVNEYSQGHKTTALFDAVTSIFSFGAYKGGGGGFGGQFAFAGGRVGSAVGAASYAGAGGAGAAIGAIENNIEKLFKPYFASDTGGNDGKKKDGTPSNTYGEELAPTGRKAGEPSDFDDIKGGVFDDVLDRIPVESTIRKLTPDSKGGAQVGVEYSWFNSDGKTVRVRVHDIDNTSPSGSNARSGWVVRYQLGQRFYDPETQTFLPKNAHKTNSGHRTPENAEALDKSSNDSHIPIQTPNSSAINKMRLSQ
jgi:RHS repeat-associated protein